MKTMTCFIWTGEEAKKVSGKLYPFVAPERKQATKYWCKKNNKEYVQEYDKVQLFNAESKWWLFYCREKKANGKIDYTKMPRMTGHFNSRKEAVGFFNGNGR